MKVLGAFTISLLMLSLILSVSQAQTLQNVVNTTAGITRIQAVNSGVYYTTFGYLPEGNNSADPLHELASGKYFIQQLQKTPSQGNVLVAVVGLKGCPNNGPPFYVLAVTNISEPGVCWTKVVNSSGYNLACEIWLGIVGSNPSQNVTVNLPNYQISLIGAATLSVFEYSGLSMVNPTDQIAVNGGFGALFDTGQTGCTTKENELWVGAITIGGSVKQSLPKNGFELLTGTPNSTLGYMSTAYLEKVVNKTGTANTGTEERESNGNPLYSDWAGCIATFSQTQIQPSPSQNPSSTTTANTTTPLPSTTSTQTNQTADPSSFNIQTNSSLTAFSFDSNIPQISFYVTGHEDSTGYVKLTIAKTLMPNADHIQVYLDGNLINREINSNGDSWIVTFTYHHSSHQVTINTTQNPNDSGLPGWVWNAATIAVALGVAAAVCLIVWLAKKNS